MKIIEIKLTDLTFHAHHGVMPQETKVGNEFSVTLSVKIPFSDDIMNDNITATISYADIYAIVEEEMKKPRKLIETVAASIQDRLCANWSQIINGTITICKSTPPISNITGSASVSLFF